MFDLGKLAANVLNSIDNAAKETLEEPKLSATAIRSQRKGNNDSSFDSIDIEGDNYLENDDNDISVENNTTTGEVPTFASKINDYAKENSDNTNPMSIMVNEPTQAYRTENIDSVESEALPQDTNEGISNPVEEGSSLTEEYAQVGEDHTTPDRAARPSLDQVIATDDYVTVSNNSVDSKQLHQDALNQDNDTRNVVDGIDELSSDVMSPVAHTVVTHNSASKADDQESISTPFTPVVSSETHPSLSKPPTNPYSAQAVARAPLDVDNAIGSSNTKSLVELGNATMELLSSGGSGIGLSLLASGSKQASASGNASAAPGTSSHNSAEVNDLKKIIRKKNQEIEKLNRECLELEEQVSSLKQEVHEAWDHYKQAQEKAAATESEMQDEFKQVQRAKQLEKQQSIAQMNKLQEELAATTKQVTVANAEKDSVMRQLSDANEINSQWAKRLTDLEKDLMDCRAGSAQGVQALREELNAAHSAAEQMRSDHAALLRQNQLRQTELEKENTELSSTIATQQKELKRLEQVQERMSEWLEQKEGAAGTGESSVPSFNRTNSGISHNYHTRDSYALQQEVTQLAYQVEQLQNERTDLLSQIKGFERESRAAQLSYDDEKKRSSAVIEELSNQVMDLESQLKNLRQNSKPHSSVAGDSSIPTGVEGFFGSSATDSSRVDNANADSNNLNAVRELKEQLRDQRTQNQNLSKLLLKKQNDLLELQAEKSTLKSKIADLNQRCTSAEQQLAQLRDLEEDAEDFYDNAGDDSNSLSTPGLQQRKVGGTTGDSASFGSDSTGQLKSRRRMQSTGASYKVITDLERLGVKPGTGVASAVNLIDGWTLFTGRLLRTHPLVRLGFVLYLLILHMWVLLILVIHTHSLEITPDAHEQLLH